MDPLTALARLRLSNYTSPLARRIQRAHEIHHEAGLPPPSTHLHRRYYYYRMKITLSPLDGTASFPLRRGRP